MGRERRCGRFHPWPGLCGCINLADRHGCVPDSAGPLANIPGRLGASEARASCLGPDRLGGAPQGVRLDQERIQHLEGGENFNSLTFLVQLQTNHDGNGERSRVVRPW